MLRTVGGSVRDQYRVGLGLFVAAPLAVLLVMVPEFVQHVVEIRLGMFDSLAAARALSQHATRWAFGYAKLAGLALAFVACARAAWLRLERPGGRWFGLRDVGWQRLLVGFALFLLIGSLAEPIKGQVPGGVLLAIQLALSIASLPFLILALSGLFGDRRLAWRDLLRRSAPAVLLLILLMLTGFGVMQVIHAANHKLALGAPEAIVWALMIWDTLVVGALAALTGAAWAIAYRQVAR